jgi:two-component system NtrC family sensor kinase
MTSRRNLPRDQHASPACIGSSLPEINENSQETRERPDKSPRGYIAISIADTGVGIAQQQFGHIFEPFFTTRVGRGTGRGLSQVFGFAKQSGGEVSVESEVGNGSILTLYPPRVLRDDRRNGFQSRTVAGPCHGMSVLAVEDIAEVGTFATDALTELGYNTTLVGNAAGALAELTANADRFDVVFSDVVASAGSISSGKSAAITSICRWC